MSRSNTTAIQLLILTPVILGAIFLVIAAPYVFADSIFLARLVFSAVLSVPGIVIGLAWRKSLRGTTTSASKFWNAFNFGSLVAITSGYLHFISGVLIMFTRWRQSFESWLLYRHEITALVAYTFLGAFCALCVFCGRGPARKQIILAAILFSITSFIFLVVGLSG